MESVTSGLAGGRIAQIRYQGVEQLVGPDDGFPAAIAWGWPLVSIFILIIGLCMSELVSAYPTSGGIYWWAAKMGGPRAGFFTGWLNLIGLVAVDGAVPHHHVPLLLSPFHYSTYKGS